MTHDFEHLESASGAHILVDGKDILSFGGCCYLGLAKCDRLKDAGHAALDQFGGTAQMSRYYGYLRKPNMDAEEAARSFLGMESAMYFSTGYLFGQIALTGLAPLYDVIFLDEKAHYSLADGAVLSGKPIVRFSHRDPADLARRMVESLSEGQIPLVATDGMFPTFGDIAPLDEYKGAVDRYHGWLVVDESHSFGSIGKRGRGAAELMSSGKKHLVVGGSTGKALCAFGGIAAGETEAIDRMRTASAARGSAAGSAASAAMTAASINYLKDHPWMMEKLRFNARRLKDGLASLGIDAGRNDSPIATFTLGKAEDMKALQKSLYEKGIFVGYTTYIGAGPEGAIRCAVFSDHEAEDIDRLLSELQAFLGGLR